MFWFNPSKLDVVWLHYDYDGKLLGSVIVCWFFLRNILGSEALKRSFSVASVNSGAVTHD